MLSRPAPRTSAPQHKATTCAGVFAGLEGGESNEIVSESERRVTSIDDISFRDHEYDSLNRCSVDPRLRSSNLLPPSLHLDQQNRKLPNGKTSTSAVIVNILRESVGFARGIEETRAAKKNVQPLLPLSALLQMQASFWVYKGRKEWRRFRERKGRYEESTVWTDVQSEQNDVHLSAKTDLRTTADPFQRDSTQHPSSFQAT
ncbi:hypothetical protein BDQ17DRAFT_1435900 [Cyathus striatus]|nr:hypothetical protein BDQ17DRAFT_1435900 [Cyathus striatus]